ncbi:SNF2 family N-terminal domain-containing protein [Chytridium lagenaria]|nr:SNF2 family N-terminal domain-containing protein [Chytridium lagenaria]
MEKRVAGALSPFLDRLRIEAIIPKSQYHKYTASLSLTLYGTRSSGKEIGEYLLQNKISLSAVLRPISHPYENPHQYLHSSRSIVSVEASANDTKSQIDAIYNALTAAEDLPEMEPDPALITRMYKHQKQALQFMAEKERIIDHKRFDPKKSLWQYDETSRIYKNVITSQRSPEEPGQTKGGILADDMGLGKTIEIISLLLKERAGEEFFSLSGSRRFKSPGTLIVCPLSTVQNWEEQVMAHVKADHLKVNIYHGQNRCQDPSILSKYDVVLTTYSVFIVRIQQGSQSWS